MNTRTRHKKLVRTAEKNTIDPIKKGKKTVRLGSAYKGQQP